MKRLRLPLLCAAFGALLLSPMAATGQISISPIISFDFDAEELGIGAAAHVGVTAGDRELLANPSVEVYLFDDIVTFTRINLDVALPFSAGESFSPFVGAGLAVELVSIDDKICEGIPLCEALAGSDTDFGINVFVGSFFMSQDAPIRPFARLGGTLGAGTGLSVQAGASFNISK